MSTAYPIHLSSAKPAVNGWKASAAVYPGDQAATIYLEADEAENLRKIQRAGRQLDGIGIHSVALSGNDWDQERQWAFARGYMDTLSKNTIDWAAHDAAAVEHLEQLLDTTVWARELVNLPPNAIYPESLAERVIEKLTAVGQNKIQCRVIKGDELLKEGWTGIHTVGRASIKPPLMLIVDYNPTGQADAPTQAVLVGKGITFDSGGYSIKSSEGMVSMKCDMAGAATVAGALALAIQQGLNERVQLVLCCAENLIDGHAYKLGDIITYKNGMTVEIVNTDAEGRLVLADGLQYAGETGAPLIIDAATLTGAAQVAVGNEYNALFSVDDQQANRALALADETNELLWRLPLQQWHKKNCPSPFADTANSRPQKGGGTGGASNAAGFLLNFAPRNGEGWLHFDIAGAYHASATGLNAAGATALGIRTISRLLRSQ